MVVKMPSKHYQLRVVDSELDELLPILPVIAPDSAEGAGKTATATQRASTVHELHRPEVLDLHSPNVIGSSPDRHQFF